MTQQTQEDPFAGADSVPSVSFRDCPVGTSYSGTVTEAPKLVQARDYDSQSPAYWPDGGPKQTVVTRLSIDGEERSLWAAKPSAMFRAIADAQKEAGSLIAVGGKLTVTFISEKPNENKRLNPQKIYKCVYAPPDAFAQQPAQAPYGDSSRDYRQDAARQQANQAAPVGPIQYSPEQVAAAKAAGIPLPGHPA